MPELQIISTIALKMGSKNVGMNLVNSHLSAMFSKPLKIIQISWDHHNNRNRNSTNTREQMIMTQKETTNH